MASSSMEGSMPTMDEYEALLSTTDVELLKRAWRSEKAAPEILRYDFDLVGRVTEQLQLMEETVEEKSTSGADPLSLSLYQMDLDRTLFLLRSYLRIRIQKIEKYMFHIRKSDELWNRLSKGEKDFASRCIDDLKQHLEESVLSKLPENYQSVEKQSVISEEDDMVPEPRLDTFVLCRSKEYLSGIQLEDGPVDDRSKLFEMEPGVLYFICYKSIKPLVESGKIDLL
ncbi:DNA replication complex GINS protein SLD5 isoform X1 [Arachis ipaensis]|uniref:DNA replication complex GINS protein SLD5 n=1 Tax=Arachis hypogaea TaxID=3818 RepID=UPI0007AEF192|nr:DNA replication complex GINS protein SLD5 isoform X1 [Arachis ipaensis]XP_025633396.1 DNA replication complex GINS protein SLD5 isoform X1 [Arachis hypogaea]